MSALLPAVATPLILRLVPTEFLPILVGDYLALHFGLYGLILAAGTLWLRRQGRGGAPSAVRPVRLLAATAAYGLFGALALGLAVDAFVANLTPAAPRWPLIAALLAGTLPFFLADAWLTRAIGAPRGAHAAGRALFLVSLAIAIALDLETLFFLIIIVPAILAVFLVYGLFGAWVERRTGSPWPAVVVEAVVIAWAVAVTFPVVGPVVG